MELWIKFMKELLSSTVSEAFSIGKKLQLAMATTLIRADMHGHLTCRSDDPLLFGHVSSVGCTDNGGTLFPAISLHGSFGTYTLSSLERCWLHIHIITMRQWAAVDSHSWRHRYFSLVRGFEVALHRQIRTSKFVSVLRNSMHSRISRIYELSSATFAHRKRFALLRELLLLLSFILVPCCQRPMHFSQQGHQCFLCEVVHFTLSDGLPVRDQLHQ